MSEPFVIGHRGASGYRPENTIAAFEVAIQQQADGIEFDLVTTKDQVIVIRHENALNGTTDISDRPEFRKYLRSGVVDGEDCDDWFTEDLTLEQIKSLRAIERLADLRPGSSKFDGQFEIPTFGELLDQEFLIGKKVVCEIKAGSHLGSLDKSVGQLTAECIAKSKAVGACEFIIESFDYELLLDAKQHMNVLELKASYFLALDDVELVTVDFSALAEQISGLAISLAMLRAEPDWVSLAHEAGLVIWVYTARAEESTTTIEAYYEEIIQTGVDGIFADQPDLLRRVIADRSGSAYDY